MGCSDRLFRRAVMFLLLFLTLVAGPVRSVASPPLVYVIPIHGTIDAALVRVVERGLAEAERAGAGGVVLEIDTPGGLVEAALELRDLLHRSPLTTVAYVTERAISAGVLVSLAAERLYMAPGSTIGGAQALLGTQPADEKTTSIWAAELAATAQEHGRDPQIARAMADPDIALPGMVEKGKLLTLTDQEARDLGWIDGVLAGREEVLAAAGFAGSQVVELQLTAGERLARLFANPYYRTLLLTVGLAGLVIELFTVGFGVAGAIGLLALALYFGGSMLAALSGWAAVVLFVVGLVLLGLEVLVVPGFGLAGVSGLAAVVLSIVLASPSWQQAVLSMAVALAGTAGLLALSLRLLPARKAWNRLILHQAETTEEGFVAPAQDLSALLGRQGRTLSPLRPAGVAEFGGERYDVVSEGGFLDAGTPVKVVKVEGVRVVVRPLQGGFPPGPPPA